MAEPAGRRSLLSNSWSWLGLILLVVGIAGSGGLGLAELLAADSRVYRALFAWLVFPGLAVLGLILMLWGMWREQNRRRALFPKSPSQEFRIDLGHPRTRRLVLLALVFAAFYVGFAVFTGYHAYEFTESTEFCASACHSIMQPERVTHRVSPHAAVRCASCHVGRTPAQYIEAKLFGLTELYLLLTNGYERPIATPIQRMEPVRENCTGCHWEGQYWGKVHHDYFYYVASEDQPWTLSMNLKVGGRFRTGEQGEGIHWHMLLDPRVEYKATDARLQQIPWVRLVRGNGEEIIFQSTDEPIPEAELENYETRRMDCVDCHNRPAHQFKPSSTAVNDAIARGIIDTSLPEIKARGVEMLEDEYTSQDEAANSIAARLIAFYREEHPDIIAEKEDAIIRAGDALADIFRQNHFPGMKANWKAYPDNIGHFFWDGCFRCHDGRHQSAEGATISSECSLCHDVVAQGPPGQVESSLTGLEFQHPVDFGMPIGDMGKCTECHAPDTE